MGPMMSWMLRLAWGEVAAGGGAARIMSPLPSAPRPPGPQALVGSPGRCRRDFSRRPDPGHLCRPPVAGVSLSLPWLCGPWAAGERRPPPPAEARVCARVCAGGGGCAVCPLSPETPRIRARLQGMGPFPSWLLRSPLPYPNQEVLKISAPQKPYSIPTSLPPCSALLPGSPS